MTFAEKLRAARKEAGLSQEQLAEKLCVQIGRGQMGGRQYLARVSKEFITTVELPSRVDPKKFSVGVYEFRKAAYRLI